MKKDNRFWAGMLGTIATTLVPLVALLYFVSTGFELNHSVVAIALLVSLLAALCGFLGVVLFDEIRDRNTASLNKLIRYKKRRNEIEQAIGRLTEELMNTDVGEYLDINRLAFSGQQSLSVGNTIDYRSFLERFGIDGENVKTKTGTAAFLTPFDSEGMDLFESCQRILGKVDIFLRTTTTHVQKDDILMNIVELIVQSEFVLVNIDGRNPNVYYELGIAHAIGKPTILLSHTPYASEDVGFDIQQKRIILYKDNADLETQLLSQISMLSRKHYKL